MKKYHILKFATLTLLLSISIQLLFAQNSKNYITFVFKKYENNKIFTTLQTGEKYIEFDIIGYDNQNQIDTLIKHISGYRGVTSFIVTNDVTNNKKTAKLTCYKNADNLLYYKHLFFVNNVQHLIVDGKELLTENLIEIEK